jgi:hypothetical protein
LQDITERQELQAMEQSIQAETFTGIQTAALADRIEQGQAGRHDIAAAGFLFEEDGSDNPVRAQLNALADKSIKDRRDKTTRVNSIASALGVNSLDPRDKSHARGLDEFYEDRVLPQLTNLNPQLRAEAELGLVKQLGTIPNRLAQTTRTHLTHGTPEAATFAANSLMKLTREIPTALAPIPPKDLSRAALLTTYTQTGLDPATAADRANEALTTTPAITTERDTDFAATLEDNLFDEGLLGDFGDGVFDPDDLIFPNPGFEPELPKLPNDWNTSPVEPKESGEGDVEEERYDLPVDPTKPPIDLRKIPEDIIIIGDDDLPEKLPKIRKLVPLWKR